ncbi:hypothetical protein RJ640_006341 [Escallonia rubra]|uniref:GCK domain-containing protein n=1 Tax=Escallonia rubra TaxID=112253 RepID=A0AA88R6C2_9ASTE|nr:hypothetical protein RJ640_006341 [Escallonia rubra]
MSNTESTQYPKTLAIQESSNIPSIEKPKDAQQSTPPTENAHIPKTPETQEPPTDQPSTEGNEEPLEDVATEMGDGAEVDDEEEGECGFCLFMKGGGCKDTFIEWEKCIEEGEKNKEDIVEKCFQATSALKKCMEAHEDYYYPILKAEKVAEEEAAKELEKDKEKEKEGDAGASPSDESGSTDLTKEGDSVGAERKEDS